MTENGFDSNLIVWYPFDDAELCRPVRPSFLMCTKRTKIKRNSSAGNQRSTRAQSGSFEGGVYGTSYLELLPENL